VQSALRTLDAEGSGITALTAALQSDLGPAFAAAAELIRNAKGRLIITARQIRPHRPQDRGDLRLHRHAGVLRPCGGGQPWRLGMITADDVILALSWSGEQPEMKNLITYAKRFRIALTR